MSPSVVLITVTQKAAAQENADESWWDMLPEQYRRRFEQWGGRRGRRTPARPEKTMGQGSGIIITEDGYILTNNHVVEQADTISVRLMDGRRFDATIKGRDPESDIAVIKIDAKGLTKAMLGDSDKTRVGEFAIAIGAPFSFNYSVTVGHVSGKGRSKELLTEGFQDKDFIQTDASINPGNSGGPLVNLYDEVIGINAMILGMNTGIGFAIPINLAKRVADHLMHEGKFTRSRIGVGIDDLRDQQDFKELDKSLAPDVDDGAVVTAILPNGPAAKSDLKAGDVITAVNGKTVKSSRQLQDEIFPIKVGQVVALSVVRGKEHLTIKITTDAMPSDDTMAQNSPKNNGQVDAAGYGLTVQALTKDVAEQLNIEVGSGVVVASVEPNSPAEEHHIKAGDVITEINRKPVNNPRQFREAVRTSDPKHGMMVNLVGEQGSRFLVLKSDGQ